MFRKIVNELAKISGRLEAMEQAVRDASETPRDTAATDAVAERVSRLEGALQAVRGEVEAGVIRADALKATARAAEDRARGHMKRAEGYARITEDMESREPDDPFEAAARAYSELAQGDVPPDANDLSPVSSYMEGRRQRRSVARSAKRR